LHKFNLHASDDANDDAGNYVGVSDDASDGWFLLCLWENLVCLKCVNPKLLNLKVCNSNLTIESL
jgi:hypothetical protein